MDLTFNNNRKDNYYSTIFSKIKYREPEKKEHYTELQDNLSKLEHSVYLLRYYATRGKINPKKIKKKFFSSPKTFQTEPNNRRKVTRRMIKNIDLELNLNKEDNNVNTLYNNPLKESSLNNKKNKKLFMTNINYKRKKQSPKNMNSKNDDNTTKTNNETLPPVTDKNNNNNNDNNNPTFSTFDNSPLKGNIDKKNDKNNSKHIKFAKIIKTNLKSKSIYKKELEEKERIEKFPKLANYMIKSVKRENNNIRNEIYNGMDKFNIMSWYMQTRFKYAQYKFGIAEIQKYFMDLKAYGKPEEEEIDKRKTFYEHAEDIIKEIQDIKEAKEFEKLNKKYGVEQDKKKIIKSKKATIDNDDPQEKQIVELSKALQQIAKRQKNEEQTMEQINKILFKCKQGIHSIYNFDKKIHKKK